MLDKRFFIIFSKNEIKRIYVTEKEITVDVHGLKCREAYRLINNLVNLNRRNFCLKVIHGYNHGTAIKDMLGNKFKNKYVTDIVGDPTNQGITYLQVA